MKARFLLAALLLAACTAVSAASVAERSPFTQGQWWDPTRAGNGFELFNVGDQAMAIWFTFDDQRNPVWYTAQGTIGKPWPIVFHSWVVGTSHRADPVEVGTLTFDFLDDSQADVKFTLRGRTGTWRIEPFNPGAKTNEVDHSGSYYDPAHPGWGFTLTEQGSVLGGVLYYYDVAGYPTWVAGFARDSLGSVGMVTVRGSCPGCVLTPTDRVDGGRIDIDMQDENRVVLRAVLNTPAVRGIEIDGAKLVQLGRPASGRTGDRLPASFASAQELKPHLERVMKNMAFGSDPAAGGVPSLVQLTALRLEDSGADECDLVRSNASHVYTFGHDGVSRPMAHLRVAQIGLAGGSLDVRPETIALSSGFNTPTFAAALCLGADALATITSTQPFLQSGPVGTSSGYMKGRTYVEVFGLADPARPASRWWAELDGHVLTSFRIGDRLYVVLRHAPTVQGLDYRFAPSSEAMNRQVLADAPLSVLTPQVRPNGGEAVALVSPAGTFLAPQGSRRRADFIVVVAIDLREARIVDSLAILGGVETARVSGNDLFLAGLSMPGTGTGAAQGSRIYQVRLGLQGMSVVGTGLVEGSITTNGMQGTPGRQLRVLSATPAGSRLTILEAGERVPEFLRSAWTLPNAGLPTPIPNPNAVRFAGDRLYVASSDGQLGVVDLAKRDEPKLAAVLPTRGALESLHALPDGRLAATGHEVGFFGIPSDLHITLYDARDAKSVREVQRSRVGPSSATTLLAQEPYGLTSVLHADGAVSLAFPARLPSPSPAVQSGLVHFELRDPASFNAGFTRYPDLFGFEAAPLPGARAVIYPEAVIYVNGGRFWRQDNNGNVTGPF
jgi:hypothetical protein